MSNLWLLMQQSQNTVSRLKGKHAFENLISVFVWCFFSPPSAYEVFPRVLIYLLRLSPRHYPRIPNFPPPPPYSCSSTTAAWVSTPVALLSSCDLQLSTTDMHSLFCRHTEIVSGPVQQGVGQEVGGGGYWGEGFVTVISARCQSSWG